MDFTYNKDNADLCAYDVKNAYTSTMNLFCPTTRADVFVISIPKLSTMTDRLNLFQKNYQIRTQQNALKDNW